MVRYHVPDLYGFFFRPRSIFLRLSTPSMSTWLPTLLGVLTLGQLGTGVAICVRANVTHGIESIIRPERPLLISWQTLEAMADLIIAFSMSYYLQNRRTGFRRTDTVIRKLIVYAINTGLVTSVLALVVMFAFAFYGFHFVHMLFILPLGGVYTVSLLANLHSRSILREELYSEHGISIHVSRLPPTIQNRINSVAQRIEMHYSGEETDQTLLAAGPSSSRPSRAETEATRHSGQSGTLKPEILWSGHVKPRTSEWDEKYASVGRRKNALYLNERTRVSGGV
ncbi:uncharacterized protein EI90DRAFT_89449 [Cantharellus anzutake]|uniref:uncharacterized protein n=1 Tax=Cantharellus anzutake TaxID=1750568 RepID=UPI00190385C5|nr:uncharacterized protein EI90DRAFT_89449 [Cantharellus anzutake]KAF8336950.1 hypothetical protein EI90DRAFT_89449 [Cantharellus anzutake]